jgi:hypothetical protein
MPWNNRLQRPHSDASTQQGMRPADSRRETSLLAGFLVAYQ